MKGPNSDVKRQEESAIDSPQLLKEIDAITSDLFGKAKAEQTSHVL